MQQLLKPTPLSSLSPVHAMLGMLEVQKDAKRLNEIVNHPEVYSWVRGSEKGLLDLTQALAIGDKICLLAKHGGVLFHYLQPGLWEAHTQILPEGRGEWGLDCVRACLMWLFSRTDAVEVMTRCPKGNIAALALAKAVGGTLEFTVPNGWIMDDEWVPASIWSLKIQDWMRTAPGLPERGAWFCRQLQSELARHKKTDVIDDDLVRDRYLGAACEMMLGGMPHKGAVFYSRFSMYAGYPPVSIISTEPLAMLLGRALVLERNGEFSIPSLEPLH